MRWQPPGLRRQHRSRLPCSLLLAPALLLQEGCEFLIAETADGKLNLQDSFVTTDISSSSGHDEDEERPAPSYRRPEGLAQVANGQQEYQAVPWYSQYQGDIIRDKPVKQWVRMRAVPAVPGTACRAVAACWRDCHDHLALPAMLLLQLRRLAEACANFACLSWPDHHRPTPPASACRSLCLQVWRYYLVPVASREPYLRLDLDQPLYVLDGKAATLSLAEVHRLAPPDTPAEELRLRIRCGAGARGALSAHDCSACLHVCQSACFCCLMSAHN